MTVDLVDTTTGEIYEAGLTPFEARELTDEIRQTLTLGHDLLIRAYTGRAWTALGYATWDAYCAGEFAEARMVRLDREQRREIVAEMRQAGMATTSIASAIGVSKSTVHNDLPVLEAEGVELPTTIVETSGRVRVAKQAAPAPVPAVRPVSAPKRRPLTDGFRDATYDLTKVTERLERLVADDRFPQNAEQVAARHRSDLLRAAEALARVLDRFTSA